MGEEPQALDLLVRANIYARRVESALEALDLRRAKPQVREALHQARSASELTEIATRTSLRLALQYRDLDLLPLAERSPLVGFRAPASPLDADPEARRFVRHVLQDWRPSEELLNDLKRVIATERRRALGH